MLIKAQKDVTKISDNDVINNENYMESLNYISNLYTFINKLKTVVSTKDVKFLPSFFGRYTSEKLKIIVSDDKCCEMKIIKVESNLFFEDKIIKKINSAMKNICEEIQFDGNIGTFILF